MKDHQFELLKKLLPVEPGILDKKELFCSAVLVLLAYIDGEYHFIFEKRSPHVRQGGQICFPGGHIDPDLDANSEETAIRETIEELGITREKITVLGKMDTFVAPIGVSIEAYLAVAHISNIAELTIQTSEVERVFSVPITYFMEVQPKVYDTIVQVHPSYIDENGKEVVLFPARELGLEEMYTKPWGERRLKMYIYNVENEVIWGLTSRFIIDIVTKLKNLAGTGLGNLE